MCTCSMTTAALRVEMTAAVADFAVEDIDVGGLRSTTDLSRSPSLRQTVCLGGDWWTRWRHCLVSTAVLIVPHKASGVAIDWTGSAGRMLRWFHR